MNRGFLFLAILLLGSCALQEAYTGSIVADPDTGRILKTIFGDHIKYKSEPADMLVYCPDNTCDEFVLENSNNIRALNDFVYLLFIHAELSNMPRMGVFKNSQSPMEVNIVLQRNSDGCVKGKGFAHCVILGLQEKYDIRATFVRYDEMTRNEVKTDIREILSSDN